MSRPRVYSIGSGSPFADTLASGLIAQFGRDRLSLAHGLLILPNHRALRAMREAFVRLAEPALLLPRMVTIGDDELSEAAGLVFDGAEGETCPPAIDPLHRRILLARLIEEEGVAGMNRPDPENAFRLAAELARVLDALEVERTSLEALQAINRDGFSGDLSDHWSQAYAGLSRLAARYTEELSQRGLIDQTTRRNLILERTARQWQGAPPPGFVVAAGISTAAPAVAELLATVARLEQGCVVLSGCDLSLSKDEWVAIQGTKEEAGEESHPQYHLSVLLNRMQVGLGEVEAWPGDPPPESIALRTHLVAEALTPARFTSAWHRPGKPAPLLEHVSVHRFAGPADEAQGIAIALREALEVPGQTAALVTPDRALAVRVAAHLRRWGIMADDSAGQPLSQTQHGTLWLAMARLVAQNFAPAALLAVLKHPLVMTGEARRDWLDGARWLDKALRGPLPSHGLAGIAARLNGKDKRESKAFALARDWWRDAATLLAGLDLRTGETFDPAHWLEAMRTTFEALCGEAAWQGSEGRALAELVTAQQALLHEGPQRLTRAALPGLTRDLLDTVSIRPAWGGHPRIAIWGLLEARLQRADLLVLGSLNEGVWPQLAAPDPFLAPRIRRELGLPGLDFRIGLSAHDFVMALGAPRVIVTRAERDATAPTIESRLLLRLAARGRPDQQGSDLVALSARIDEALAEPRTTRPEPAPPAAERPRKLSISNADLLAQDPYGFFARTMLKLSRLDPVESSIGARERGNLVHDAFERWAEQDAFAAGRLIVRFDEAAAEQPLDATMRAFDLPRLRAAMAWADDQLNRARGEGREPLLWEQPGELDLGKLRLTGKPDRIDRLADGSLAIVDYKTGSNPKARQVQQGFALQLGLLGMMAEEGAFDSAQGKVSAFEYWRLNRDQKNQTFGWVAPMTLGKDDSRTLAKAARDWLEKLAANWLFGDNAFEARLHPDYPGYGDYDQLMRLEEWYGPQG